jgi:predicted nuclease of predicted toxin-antitoxin system
MKILLDECLPLDFRHSFPTHDAHTAQWAGLKSKNNGGLPKLQAMTFCSAGNGPARPDG